MAVISEATSPEDIVAARELFSQYAQSLGFSLCFQGFDQELANLPGKYASPDGRLLLARNEVQNTLMGCVALRKLDDEVCEMKRLYVTPDARGHGVGRALVLRVIQDAASIGYLRMRLDTVPGKMDSAIGIYRTFGFQEIPPYNVSPFPGVLYLECDLAASTISKPVHSLLKLNEKL